MTEEQQNELAGQLEWYESLLEVVQSGDIETAAAVIRAAIKLKRRTESDRNARHIPRP